MSNSRGPKPLPNAVLKARGSTLMTKERENGSPESPPGPTEPPKYLSKEESEKWVAMVPVLLAMKVFTEADVDALVKYCRWWVQLQDLEVVLKDEGYLINYETREGKGRKIKNPAFDMISELAKRLKDLDACFGLTPSARARIDIKAAPPLPTAQQPKAGPLKVVPRRHA